MTMPKGAKYYNISAINTKWIRQVLEHINPSMLQLFISSSWNKFQWNTSRLTPKE